MRTFAQLAQHVLDTITCFGLDISPNSRIARMCRALVLPDGRPTPFVPTSAPSFPVVLEAIRDVQQFAFIFDQIGLMEQPADFQQRLKSIVKDSVLPQDHDGQSVGRDRQCEFYVAAICAKGGLRPVFNEQPDLRISLDGQTFGIAVKRCKSLGKFEDHVRKGARQIRESGVPGMIVCDMSLALNNDNERIDQPWTNRQFDTAWRKMLNKFMDDHIKRIYEWVEGRHVHGIVLLDSRLRQPPGEEWGLEAMSHFTSLTPNNERRKREFFSFRDQFVTGLATPARAAPR